MVITTMNNYIKRIVFIANTRLNYTNILQSMLFSLLEMGYYVKDIDITNHVNITNNPNQYMGGHGPVEVKYDKIKDEIEYFKPELIIFAGGGLTFSEEISEFLKNKGIILIGITLSDPDVFNTAKNYVRRFSYHTTNSKKSYNMYKKLGFQNTLYLPFGIDSRFFIPIKPVPEYECDVVIMGHFRKERLKLADQLIQRFNTKIYGRGWPYNNIKPIAYPEWLKAIHSSKLIIDFPKTEAGFHNIKVRLFEVAATGKTLITEKSNNIKEFFEIDKEIIVYDNYPELYDKIQYYLDHSEERIKIGRKAQLTCAEKHMWHNRFKHLFETIDLF